MKKGTMGKMGMKVWGGAEFHDGVQKRIIVAARTKKRCRELVEAAGLGHLSAGRMRDYWSDTGNDVELSVATREGVWVGPLNGARRAEEYKCLYINVPLATAARIDVKAKVLEVSLDSGTIVRARLATLVKSDDKWMPSQELQQAGVKGLARRHNFVKVTDDGHAVQIGTFEIPIISIVEIVS